MQVYLNQVILSRTHWVLRFQRAVLYHAGRVSLPWVESLVQERGVAVKPSASTPSACSRHLPADLIPASKRAKR